MKKILYYVLMLTIALAIIGCTDNVEPGNTNATAQKSQDTAKQPQFSGSFGNAKFGESAIWPEYIPEDIPRFECDIETVMAGDNRIRIFFTNVSDKYLKDYLNLLEKKGFALKYQVYIREGFPDNSEERIKKKDYDAVKATKGSLGVHIEFGGNEATYDIDTSGFPEGTKIITGPTWPLELASIIPEPKQVEYQSVNRSNDGAINVICSSSDSNGFDNYIQILMDLGFEKIEVNKNQNSEVYEVTLRKQPTVVKVRRYQPKVFGITVWLQENRNQENFNKLSTVEGKWPVGLPESIPAFSNGTVKSILTIDEKTYLLMIVVDDDHAVDDYTQLLISNGFSKSESNVGSKKCYTNSTYEITIDELMMSNNVTIKIHKND